MSRAFVKEDVNGPTELPDLPLSPHPNYVTPRGLASLQARLRDTQTTLAQLRARAERLDKLPEAAAERDIRYLEARLRSAILVDPARHAGTEVAFGHRVTVADPEGVETTYEITGEELTWLVDRVTALQEAVAPICAGRLDGPGADAPGLCYWRPSGSLRH